MRVHVSIGHGILRHLLLPFHPRESFEGRSRKIASVANTLEENNQSLAKARDSLVETGRQMRLLILRVIRLRKSKEQMQKILGPSSSQLKEKECLLESLALEARRINISIEQSK